MEMWSGMHDDILSHLLSTATLHLPPADVLEHADSEIKPYMHQKLADWMLDVWYLVIVSNY